MLKFVGRTDGGELNHCDSSIHLSRDLRELIEPPCLGESSVLVRVYLIRIASGLSFEGKMSILGGPRRELKQWLMMLFKYHPTTFMDLRENMGVLFLLLGSLIYIVRPVS